MSWFINSHLWVLIVCAQYFFVCYLSLKASKKEIPLVIVWSVGVLPSWTIVCKYANDVALSGFVYDFAVAFGWTIGVIVFQNKSFGVYQYAGIAFMFAGLVIFKR